MIVQFADKTSMMVESNEKWMQISGPVVQDDIYVGETYDSRNATPGWDMPVRRKEIRLILLGNFFF